jgi:hypothetical protein
MYCNRYEKTTIGISVVMFVCIVYGAPTQFRSYGAKTVKIIFLSSGVTKFQ